MSMRTIISAVGFVVPALVLRGGGGPTRNDEEEAPAGEPIYLKGGELIAYRR